MTATPTWSEQVAQAIGKLAERPGSLLLLLLALNAVARPYSGIIHDARLYSAQALNKLENGLYNDDLFFRYGSQDQFSIFSRCAAPLIGWLGLEAAFFLIYLVFNTLLIIAMKRLVEALLEDRVTSTLALVFLMVVPLNFGGLKTLHVQESFVTPRLMANAFVLFGLEQTLRGRYLAALGCMVAGMAFHPLMAVSGLLIWAGCLAWNFLPGRVLVGLTVLVGFAGGAVLATPTIATRILGTMDDTWRDIILRASNFNFVSEWTTYDWLNVAMCLLVVGAAAWSSRHDNPRLAKFLAMAVLVAVAGVVGMALAECLPYALLLQGQPYRALWILKVLEVPFAFWLAFKLVKVPQWWGPICAVVPLWSIGLSMDLALEWLFPLFFLPLLIVRYRGLEPKPLVDDWWARSLVGCLVMGSVGWGLYMLLILAVNYAAALQRLDLQEYVSRLTEHIGPISWLLLFALFVNWAARRSSFGRGFQAAMLGVFLFVQGGTAALLASTFYHDHCTCHGQDIRFVQEFLRRQNVPHMPTIYSSLGRVDLIWLDLRAKCWFDWWQMGGVMFQRQMAIEGHRRALIVGPFEVQRFREREGIPNMLRHQIESFFALDFDTVQPEVANLKQLCREPEVDYLVLTNEFPGLYAAGNGRIFIYDCRQVRGQSFKTSSSHARTTAHGD